jgi:predicted DNA-binding transcriptional regulator AlpA
LSGPEAVLRHVHERDVTMTDLLKDYLPRSELAAAIGYCEKTLIRWERDGQGPPPTRVGRKVLYLKSSVEKWLLSRESRAA